MRILRTFLFISTILLMNIMLASAQPDQPISISITNINANQQIKKGMPYFEISGIVSGLPPQDYQNYKVIVYVHTDLWYVYPYARQGEGKSWASIQANGRWQIQSSVQREFKADKVAAVLVKRNSPELSFTKTLEKMQKAAIVVKELRGTPDLW